MLKLVSARLGSTEKFSGSMISLDQKSFSLSKVATERSDQMTKPKIVPVERGTDVPLVAESSAPGTLGSTSLESPPTGDSVVAGRHWFKHIGIGSKPRGLEQTAPNTAGVTSLGSLEADILGVLWEIGRPATGMEVMEASLYKRRAQGLEPAAFATIATTLRRLAGKGLLSSRRDDARSLVYWPTVEREEMAARILNNVSLTLLGSSLHGLLPKLIGNIVQSDASVPQSDKHNEEEADWRRLLRALEEVAQVGADPDVDR